jgi:hypothetical protein
MAWGLSLLVITVKAAGGDVSSVAQTEQRQYPAIVAKSSAHQDMIL